MSACHTLWEVQQAIGEGWILADRETTTFNPEGDISLDVHDFESSRAQPTPSLLGPLLAYAVKRYPNHFLTGFKLKDAPDFNEWAFTRSEGPRHKLSTALRMLSDDYSWI